MGEVFLEVSHLKPGVIITEDVYKSTASPIVRKGTVLTDEHLDALRIFAIQDVKIKSDTLSKEDDVEVSLEPVEEVLPVEVEVPTFQSQYDEAVQQVKREFTKWQAGVNPDVAVMRAIIVPLLEQLKRPETDLAYLTTVATKEDYIYHHLVAVGVLAYSIGEKMKLSPGESIQLGLTGALIDCGMAKISPQIINKTGRLTAREYNEIKKHTVYSYQMINDTPLLRTEMKRAILQHHERLDGSGYPRGEKEGNITLYAQILGAADVYHARTSDRIYRTKESPYKVLESFKDTYQKFSIEVINALYEVTGRLSIGTKVKLTNEEVGVIVYLHQAEPFRPVVKLVANDAIVDLTKIRHLMIEEVL